MSSSKLTMSIVKENNANKNIRMINIYIYIYIYINPTLTYKRGGVGCLQKLWQQS